MNMNNNLDINGIDILGDKIDVQFNDINENVENLIIRNVDIPKNFKVNSGSITQAQILQCNVKSIKFIRSYFNLETLIIKNSNIGDIDKIKKCTKLKMLILSNVNISNLKFLCNMDTLERLNLMNCNVKDVRQIEKCKNLKILTFNQDNMKNIKGMEILEKIEGLTISNLSTIE